MFGGKIRCLMGDVQMEDRASSRLWGLAVIEGVKKDIKRDGWVSFFIICHCGKKNSKWHLQHDNFISFITLTTPMFEKQKTLKTLSYVSRTKTSPLAFCHQYSQCFVLGPLLFTDTRCADDIGLFVSSKSNHSI